MELLINFSYVVVFILLGYVFGRLAEQRHYRSILEREEVWVKLPTTSNKRVMGSHPDINRSQFVSGNVVISIDYFKRILAMLRGFFGGNVQAYETLVDRARREAILRMKESCPEANQIINLRVETSSIYKGGGNQIGSVEVLAYGTAIYFNK